MFPLHCNTNGRRIVAVLALALAGGLVACAAKNSGGAAPSTPDP